MLIGNSRRLTATPCCAVCGWCDCAGDQTDYGEYNLLGLSPQAFRGGSLVTCLEGSECNRGMVSSFTSFHKGLEFLASRSSSESSSPIRLGEAGTGHEQDEKKQNRQHETTRSSRGRLEALIPYWQQRVTKSWGAWLCTQTKQTLAQAVSCSMACVKEILRHVRSS